MKQRKLFFQLITVLSFSVAIGLASCSNDPDGDTGGGKETTEEGYFSTVIRTGTGIRTRAATPSETGIPIESKVNEVRLVLYDPTNPANMPVDYAFDYTALHKDPNANNQQGDLQGDDVHERVNLSVFTPKAKMVKKKDYKLLVIVNPTDEMKNRTQVNQTYADFYDYAHKGNVEELIGDNKNDFAMTNWQGLVTVEAQHIANTEEEAYTQKQNVFLDRMVAKVMADYTPDGSGIPGRVKTENGTATAIAWGLDVTNKSTYYMRHAAPMNNGQVESTLTDDRNQMYATDPNFEGFSLSYYDEYFAANGTGPYSRPDNPLDPNNGSFNTIGLTDVTFDFGPGTWKYALENTMQAVEQYRDVTTSVILAIDYVPAVTSIDDQVTIGGVPYFSYNGYVFTGGQLDDILSGNIDVENHPLLKNMVAHLTAARIVYGSDFATYYNTQNFSSNQIIYHASATNYYRMPLRHFDDILQPEPMDYGRFGLVRNNVYKLTLKEVTAAGGINFTDPEDPSGPSGPDESTDGWIVAEVEILDWVIRGQDVKAGEPVPKPPIPEV